MGVRGCREAAGVGSAGGRQEKGCWRLWGEYGGTRGAAAAEKTPSWPGVGLLAGPEGRH